MTSQQRPLLRFAVGLIVSSAVGAGHAVAQPTEDESVAEPVDTPVVAAPKVLPQPPVGLPVVGSAHAPTAVAGYDEGLYLAAANDEFRLAVGGAVAAGWQIGQRTDSAASTNDEVVHSFTLPIARARLHGHAFVTTDFEVSFDFGSSATGTEPGLLRDAYLDRPLAGARLRMGRFKPMFARQLMTPVTELQFAERSIAALWPDAAVNIERDYGATLYQRGSDKAGGFEWSLGVFRGRGFATADSSPLVAARVGWSSAHANSYSESDFDGGPLRLAFGVAYAGDLADGKARAMIHSVTGDVVLKAYGLALTGAVFVDSARVGQALERDTLVRTNTQLGYMLIPRKFELTARYAQIPVGNSYTQEYLSGANLFAYGHRQKWQLEAGGQRTTGHRDFDWVARVQTQLVF